MSKRLAREAEVGVFVQGFERTHTWAGLYNVEARKLVNYAFQEFYLTFRILH